MSGSGHILIALLDNDETARMLKSSAAAFEKNIPGAAGPEPVRHRFGLRGGCGSGGRAGCRGRRPPTGGSRGHQGPRPVYHQPDGPGRKGEIDPVLGRDVEIRQMVDILIRRRQNNPILTGEAGVGKTAVVEGFALRIVEGDVPEPLQNVALHTLDLGLLQAGAGIKGEFETGSKG